MEKASLEKKKKFSIFDYHTTTEQDNIIVSYKGPFTNAVLAEISQSLRQIFSSKPQLSKKLFSIFIELAQNISYYSSEKNLIKGKEDSAGVGTLVIEEYPDRITLITGNVIRNEEMVELAHKCAVINSLDREALREYKRKQRDQPRNSMSGNQDGGNIGLIQVALTANSSLHVERSVADESYSFFVLSVDLNKD